MSGGPYQSPQYPGGPPMGYPPPRQPGIGLSVTSLVLGILALPGICCWPLGGLLGILAVIFGLIAMNNVRSGTGGGQGMALAGTICGGAAILLIIVLLIFGFAMQGMQGFAPRRF